MHGLGPTWIASPSPWRTLTAYSLPISRRTSKLLLIILVDSAKRRPGREFPGRRLMEAVIHTGCRAGELTSARRASFDARTKSLAVNGKTGSRSIGEGTDDLSR